MLQMIHSLGAHGAKITLGLLQLGAYFSENLLTSYMVSELMAGETCPSPALRVACVFHLGCHASGDLWSALADPKWQPRLRWEVR